MSYRNDLSLRSFGNAVSEIPEALEGAIHDVYALKGIRAWHDHFVLHLQKLIYMLGILISTIFVVNESDRVSRHPGQIDFVFVTRPLLFSIGCDTLTIIINVLYLTTRFALERPLKQFKEPAVWERMTLHISPIVPAVLLALLAYSVPYCYLTTKYVEEAFCKSSFTPTMNRVLLVLSGVAATAHMIYGVYHHWRSTSSIQSVGRGGSGRMNDDKDGDDYEYSRLMDSDRADRGDRGGGGGRRSSMMRR